MAGQAALTIQAKPQARVRARRFRVGAWMLPGYTHLVILWLFMPIFVMILFAFNDTHGKYNLQWTGFTLKWFEHPFAIPTLTSALVSSLSTATLGMLISTVLGTLIALAFHRYAFRGRTILDSILIMNIAASEVVIGSALLTLFIAGNVPLGFLTIVLAQVMFSIPFVAVTVRARLAGFDPALEEAADDLPRRLRDHQLRRRKHADVSAVGLRRHATRRAAAGQRHRHIHLPGRLPDLGHVCGVPHMAQQPAGPRGAGLRLRSRSGRPQTLAPQHVDDPDQHHGADQGHDEGHDETGRLDTEQDRENKAADERTYYAEDDVPDDSVPVAAHDLARQPSDDGPHDQEPD